MTALLRVALGAGLLAFIGCAAPRAVADEAPTARVEVGKPVQDAQALVRQKKFAEALERLKAADAVPDKSPYETYVIAETRAADEPPTARAEVGKAEQDAQALVRQKK